MARHPTTKRRATYRRAAWHGGSPGGMDLATLLKEICEAKRKARERLVQRGDGGALFVNRWEALPSSCRLGGIRAELVAFTEGRAAEVAHTRLLESEAIDVEAQKPEEGQDFVDGRSFLIISKNHVILAPNGSVRDITISYYFQNILKERLAHGSSLNLGRVMRLDKAEAIARHGVKSIHLGTQMYSETSELISCRSDKGLFAKLMDVVRSQFSDDLSEDEIQHLSELQFEVELSLKGHRTRIGRSTLGEIARHIAEEGESDYIIELGNGMKIKPSEIVYSKDLSVPFADGQIDYARLWEKMYDFLEELDDVSALHV